MKTSLILYTFTPLVAIGIFLRFFFFFILHGHQVLADFLVFPEVYIGRKKWHGNVSCGSHGFTGGRSRINLTGSHCFRFSRGIIMAVFSAKIRVKICPSETGLNKCGNNQFILQRVQHLWRNSTTSAVYCFPNKVLYRWYAFSFSSLLKFSVIPTSSFNNWRVTCKL